MKIVAFIDHEIEINSVLKFLKAHQNDEVLYVTPDVITWYALKNLGIESQPITRYQNLKEHQNAQAKSLDFAEFWFRDNDGNDLTQFRRISFGKSLKQLVHLFFKHVLKSINNSLNILQRENPDMVVFVENPSTENPDFLMNLDAYKTFFKYVEKDQKYQLVILKLDNNESGNAPLNFFDPQRFLSTCTPQNAINSIKRLVVRWVDGGKSLNPFLITSRPKTIRALVLGATDLSYFGTELVNQFTRRAGHWIFYLEKDGRCYFNNRLHYAGGADVSQEMQSQAVLEFLSGLKLFFQKSTQEKDPPANMVFRGISLVGLCRRFFEQVYFSEIPSLLAFYLKSESALRERDIDMVLSSNNLTAKSIILLQLARRQGIPGIHIPHSHCYGYKVPNEENFLSYMDDQRYFPYYPSHEITGYEINKQLLIDNGVRPDRMFLGGVAKFEFQQPDFNSVKKKYRKIYGFGDDFVLLFPTSAIDFHSEKVSTPIQYDSFETFELYQMLIQQFESRNKHRLVLKFKPRDILIEITEKFNLTRNTNNISITTQNLKELLISCDAILVFNSAVGIEALYYEAPIIQIIKPGQHNRLPLAHEGAAIKIESIAELPAILDRLRQDESYRKERVAAQKKFLKDNLPKDNLRAAERITRIIEQIMLENSEPVDEKTYSTNWGVRQTML